MDETDERGNTSAKAYMDACTQHTGADILPFISSKEVVKDLDSIRTQLDVDVWSMVGYSYGTKLVAKYAEHYPTHLRAGVADGVVDTSESLFTILKISTKAPKSPLMPLSKVAKTLVFLTTPRTQTSLLSIN